MTAILRVVVSALFASSLVLVAAPSAAQTTRTLTVTPDTGLADGDIVLLEGSGYTPSDTVYFCQGVEASTADPANCGAGIGSVSANESGEFSATYAVQRFITPASVGSTIDCAQPSANCAMGASDFFSASRGFALAPLTFTPQPAVSLTVTPATGLNDGDVVVVEGTGFLSEQSVALCQELDDQVSEFCPTVLDFVPADETGAFSVEYTVQRFVTAVGAGVTTDCAAPSATCTISALGSGIAISGVAPIAFAPQPTVTVAAFGTVTGPTGAPLAGARVWAYTPSDSWVGSLQTVTDAQGTYEFAAFELGVPYRILFRGPSPGPTFGARWFNNAVTRQLATVITLSAGEFVQANAQLGDQSAISGSVTDTEGDPVAGVAVSAYGTGDTWVGSYVDTTDANGSYLLEGVRSDSFQVRFVPPTGSGLANEWWDDQPTRRTADFFSLPTETTIPDIDAVLEPIP